MNLTGQNIFTKVKDPEEIHQIFLDLAKSRGEISAKKTEPSADVFVLKAYDYENYKLQTSLVGAVGQLEEKEVLIGTFFLGGEKYFFQSKYSKIGDQIELTISAPIYHLQRREDYRIKIPSQLKAHYKVTQVNEKICDHQLLLMDLSAGGALLNTAKTSLTLKKSDLLKGSLYLPDRDPVEIESVAKHVSKDQAGVQFISLRPAVKNRISAFVLDVYREYFTRGS